MQRVSDRSLFFASNVGASVDESDCDFVSTFYQPPNDAGGLHLLRECRTSDESDGEPRLAAQQGRMPSAFVFCLNIGTICR